MDPLWQFKIHYLDLVEGVERGTGEGAHRRLAADLRGLLVDSTPIADAANRLFRLTVLFPVLPGVAESEFVVCSSGVSLNEALLAGPPDASKPSGSRTQHVSRDDLLALTAARLSDGSTFSVRDVILAGANLAGGVHSSGRGAEGERLLPLATAIFGRGLSTGSDVLIAVARHVTAAYRHLFTLAEGASLGLAQPRSEHMPFLRHDPTQGPQGVAIECAGKEFFEDGFPEGLSLPFVWIGMLALRVPGSEDGKAISPMADRHVFDVSPLERPGPHFSLIQRGRSILARFVAGGGEIITSPPVRLLERRFYALAGGVARFDSPRTLRVFVRLRGGDARNAEAFAPPGVEFGDPVPSRMTVGAGVDRREAKEGRGALMQLREPALVKINSAREIDAILDNMQSHLQSRRWVNGIYPDLRISILYNKMRD